MIQISEFNLRLIVLPRGYCNYRCPFCHEEGVHNARKTHYKNHIDPQDFHKLVLWLQTLGMNGVIISGGEPLMQTDTVVSILQRLPALPITVNTNGTWLSKLIPHVYELNQLSWKVNINFPSFDQILFHQLTGQKRIKPYDILSQLTPAIDAGIIANFNCVINIGKNDNGCFLNSYIYTALKYRVSNVRLILQPDSSVDDEFRLKEILKFPRSSVSERGGRVQSYKLPSGMGVELVRCESDPTEKINSGKADIYLTTRQTVKLGLWGREKFFRDFKHLQLLILKYFK